MKPRQPCPVCEGLAIGGSSLKHSYKVSLRAFAVSLAFLVALASPHRSFASGDGTVRLRVAAGQFHLQPDLQANLQQINRYLNQAASLGVDLVVFPELGLTGYPPQDIDSLYYVDQSKTENALAELRRRARELGVALAVGAAWRDEERVWRNRAFFIDERGEILATYDKIQQTSHERKFFVDGECLSTFVWRGLRLGMLICMDMRYPELWRLLRKDGAQLVLHLAAAYGSSIWKIPVLEGTLRARAASNGYFIVSCNNAGPAPMMLSAIYSPRGLLIRQANYEVDELIWADIEVDEPRGFVDFHDDVYRLEKTCRDER